MLPNTQIVVEERQKDDGLYANAKEGSIHIDSSTISPDAAKKMGTESHPFTVVDAPVTGATPAAHAGTLNFLVGCE